MKRIAATLGIFTLSAGAALAGGIDRSGQNIGILFEKGRYAEFSLGYVKPDVSGDDKPVFGGFSSGNVTDSFAQLGFGFKADVNDQLSYALIIDQPFGADVLYGGDTIAFGGTSVDAKATAITTLLRWKFNESFSVHGGMKAQHASAEVLLQGAAYGGLSGYNVDVGSDWAGGYVVGVAYEKPEIALRIALTYNSEIEHDFTATETVGGFPVANNSTKVNTPRSVNLDFQSGVAADTLLFGQIRWVKWSEFRVDPDFLVAATGDGLIDLSNTITYTLGVGRKFNETWAGSLSVTYEKEDNHPMSPLAPTNGRLGMTVAAVYTRDNMKITGGVSYTKLGDAEPQTGGAGRADFRDNHAVGVGVRVGFAF